MPLLAAATIFYRNRGHAMPTFWRYDHVIAGKDKVKRTPNRFFLIASLVLLCFTCAAAASFGLHVNVNQSQSQEPANGSPIREKEKPD